MKTMRILIIDDDTELCQLVADYLTPMGFKVEAAHLGVEGAERATGESWHAVILDVMMPDVDGFEVLRRIRTKSKVPVLMLTGRGDEVDRVVGLELGADDYLSKPFSTRELMARIKALLRRVEFDTARTAQNEQIEFADIMIDLNRRQIFKSGKEVALRFKEFELLSLLLLKAGDVVTRAEIFDKVWGTDWLGDMRTLDVHIRWLREKLEDDPSDPRLIQTVRGVGYRLVTGKPT